MTSETKPTTWEFTTALDLLHTYSQLLPPSLDGSLAIDLPSSNSSNSSSDSLSGSPKRRGTLGNFKRVFRYLNKPVTIQSLDTQVESLDDGSTDSDDDTSPPPTPKDQNTEHKENVKCTAVRWSNEDEDIASESPELVGLKRLVALAGVQHNVQIQESTSKSLNRSRPKRLRSGVSISEASSEAINTGSDADDAVGNWWLAKTPKGVSQDDGNIINPASVPDIASAKHLRPAWVTPLKTQPTAWKSPVCIKYGEVISMLNLTRREKKDRLVRRLEKKFGPRFLQDFDYPKGLWQFGGNESDNGIHVFVDSSNIVIGFNDSLKLSRGLDVRLHTKRSPISFHSLALILERGRGVAKRVLVGSSDRSGGIPEYMQEAADCGYEISSLNRVAKFKEDRLAVKNDRTGNRSGNSRPSSGSETPLSGKKKTSEQGVDEILHMKMLESIVDAKQPSTIVLATGDAAEAEYSGGFLKNVERALVRGWKVELVAWGHSMSKAYRSKGFLEKWKDQFMVIELDDFSEELLQSYIEPAYYKDVRHTGPGKPFAEDLSSEDD